MKAVKILALVCAAISVSSALAETQAQPVLVSVQYLTEGTETVALPTFKTADGSVCTSYVAEARHTTNANGNVGIEASVKQICESKRLHLASLRNFTSGDMTIQLPTTTVSE